MTRLNKRPVLALIASAVLALLLVPGAGASSNSASIAADSKHAQLPIVIGHRGASGYRPLAELLDAHSQPYSPPLPLAAIVEEPET